jgi:hypothetical protein
VGGTDSLAFLGGEGAEDDDFDSVHHGHRVRADDVGVAAEDA